MDKNKCVICKFPLKIQPTNFKTPDDEMSFRDFVIHYEHNFLRNIYTEKEIKDSDHVKDLKSYYEIFESYIAICVGLLALFNNMNRYNFLNQKFLENNFAGEELVEIKNVINKTEIKNLLSNTYKNVPKFNLNVYTYVYDKLICFPRSDIEYETITTNKFFTNVHRLIRGKFHLHHSHITGEIFGYAHDFYNTTLAKRETSEIPFITHNLLGFGLFYFLKAYIASAWCSKKLNVGSSSLTQANHGNISGEIKLIDSLKFHQRSLGELSSTLTEEEKNAVKKPTEKFLNQHFYFCTIWPYLSIQKKDKILETISEGKGIIPYEIIVDMESFFITPDRDFWETIEFFSELKQSVVNGNNYEHSKYLYQTLKMRNLGDLNDFYYAQGVILLTEITESRFQAMPNTYGFNPRKCNSASSMSGCIEIEMSKIILALPTKLEHPEIFEQTVIGEFSSVNTRLAFDLQILLPNLEFKDDLVRNPMNKNFNYKIIYNLKMNNKK